MKEGIMYVYTERNLTLEKKIVAAAREYYRKLGRVPTCVYVNQAQLDGQTVNLKGLRIVGARNIPRHYFWVGVEGTENVP